LIAKRQPYRDHVAPYGQDIRLPKHPLPESWVRQKAFLVRLLHMQHGLIDSDGSLFS
jgi:hypothetical protein